MENLCTCEKKRDDVLNTLMSLLFVKRTRALLCKPLALINFSA